jgi:hypothetical protein
MNSQTLPRFWELYYQLPPDVRQAARNAYQRFSANPGHPGLQFHRLSCNPHLWTVRVSRNHRAVGILQGNRISLIKIMIELFPVEPARAAKSKW